MLIYILHSDKYYTFNLPNEVKGSYMLTDKDEEGHIRNLINITEKNNKWYINSNDDVVINYNGKDVEQVELVNYNFYSLRVFKKNNVILYIAPGCENNSAIRMVPQNSKFIIGKNSSCDIALLNNVIGEKQVEFEYKDHWTVKNLNPSIPIYLNKKSILSATVSNFDVLFIMGMRLVFMGNKIAIISPGNLYVINSKVLQNESKMFAVQNISVEENVKDFYKQEDYFSKSPIFRKKYSEYEVTITAPETKEKGGDGSFLTQIIPSALMSVTSLVSAFFTISNYRKGNADKESFVTSIIMCAIMLFIGIVWPVIEMFASKIKRIIAAKLRVHNYKKYLKRKRTELNTVINEEKNTLEFNNLSLTACQDTILHRNPYLFSRNIDSSNFLVYKLGTGKIKSSIKFLYQKPDLIVQDDKLLDDIDKLMDDYKYLEQAPFTISLLNQPSVAFINVKQEYDSYLKSLILQSITLHDYKSLKLVFLTDEFSFLNKLKNLNHCFNDDRSFRYFANNLNEAENISSELIKILNRYSSNENQQSINTHYLIVCDSMKIYKTLKIISKVLESKGNKGFSIIMFASKITDIPTGCSAFVDFSENEASYFQAEMDEKSITKFVPELVDDSIDFDLCINTLSNIPIKIERESTGSLPDTYGFLEMFNVGKLEQLNIINRWKTSKIINSLATPVGIDSSGNIINLDLHEKYHGPHGLIAGMTGSGKSEFIVTYILSLAINYSPDEVQFVLIDYKGGGLAGAFENRKTGIKLPHLVGTITNLDKAEMNRTLVSIKSELQRRQRKFNEAKELLNTGSIDIYKYQNYVREGTLKEPMSHLFIICDEFAELKAQQPDFMDELVSAARIGRSLGIHLILATQKPSGVVDDQIWSNSKFKVCCRVQTTEDSKEMIRNDDAAYLKESGRFYLQVGYDEYYVLGQSGYSGVTYSPSDKVVSKLDTSVSFINDIGDVYKSISDSKVTKTNTESTKYSEELNEILRYIVKIASDNNYEYHQLWLDNVPKRLLYMDILRKYTNYIPAPYDINPLIGEFDDPNNQSQGIVTLPITFGGNTRIIGSAGMGKSTFLSTMIYSTIINHSLDEVNFYIMDFFGEKLQKYSKAPQVGEVLGPNDKQKINFLFSMIESELSNRQKYYSENGSDFLLEARNGKCSFPNLVIIVHGIDNFKEMYEDLYEEKLVYLTRNSSKYGINFVVTGLSSAGTYALENNFPQLVMLNLNDPIEYSTYFNENKIPLKTPGRGLIKIGDHEYEFQTAMAFEEENERAGIEFVVDKLLSTFNKKAPLISTVPRHLSYSKVLERISNLSRVPIGININNAQISYVDYRKKIDLISASSNDKLNKFINNFVNTLSLCDNNKVIVLNSIDKLTINSNENIKVYDSNYKKLFDTLQKNMEKLKEENSNKIFTIVVLGYSKINKHTSEMKQNDDNVITLDELIINSTNNFKFVLYDVERDFRNIIEGELSELVDSQSGIWLGSDYDEQDVIEVEKDYSEVKLSLDSIVLINDSLPEYVKIPTIK